MILAFWRILIASPAGINPLFANAKLAEYFA
jgi:hypothetical protein